MRLLPKIAAGTWTEKFGPFVDQTDGYSPEGALSITAALTRLSKNGGAFGAKNDATAGSHDENGYYDVVFNTTDLGTLGKLMVAFNITGALPVWEEFMVVPQAVYNLWATAADGALVMKQLRLAADDGTIPLDIDSGATCGGTAARIRAQRAGQLALDVTAVGTALSLASDSGVPVVSIANDEPGAVGVRINTPNSSAVGVDIDAETGVTVNATDGPALLLQGGGQQAAAELIGGSSAGIGVHVKGGTGSGGTGEAVRIEQTAGNNNVVVIQGAPGGSYSGTVVRVSTEGINGVGVLVYGATGMNIASSSTGPGVVITGGYGDSDGSAALLLRGLRTGVGSVITGSPGLVVEGGGHTGNPGTSGREAVKASGFGIADGVVYDKGINGALDLNVGEIGTPQNLGGGANLSQNLRDMAGATFATGTDSLEAVRDHGDVAWITGGDATAAGQAAIAALIGTPVGASIAADIASVQVDTTALLAVIGTPAGASVSADIASVQSDSTAIIALIGTPAGADVSADIAAVQATADAITTDADLRDLMFNRDVVTRDVTYQKPTQYTAGTGGNQETVDVVLDGSGNTETETKQ